MSCGPVRSKQVPGSVVRRILAVLAMAKDREGTPEGTTAQRIAERLLARHGLDVEDIVREEEVTIRLDHPIVDLQDRWTLCVAEAAALFYADVTVRWTARNRELTGTLVSGKAAAVEGCLFLTWLVIYIVKGKLARMWNEVSSYYPEDQQAYDVGYAAGLGLALAHRVLQTRQDAARKAVRPAPPPHRLIRDLMADAPPTPPTPPDALLPTCLPKPPAPARAAEDDPAPASAPPSESPASPSPRDPGAPDDIVPRPVRTREDVTMEIAGWFLRGEPPLKPSSWSESHCAAADRAERNMRTGRT
jgi:hypothetical protein